MSAPPDAGRRSSSSDAADAHPLVEFSLDRMSRSSSDSLSAQRLIILRSWAWSSRLCCRSRQSPNRADAQRMRYMSGQNVVPVYSEGWGAQHRRQLHDGVRVHEPELRGKNSTCRWDPTTSSAARCRPGAAGALLSRRQQFMFRVRVPKDWGQKDLIWTLTSHGKTEGHLRHTDARSGDRSGAISTWRPRRTARRGRGADHRTEGSSAAHCRYRRAAHARRIGDRRWPSTPRPSRSGSGSIASTAATKVTPTRQNPLSQAVVRPNPVCASATWVIRLQSYGWRGDLRAAALAGEGDGVASTQITFRDARHLHHPRLCRRWVLLGAMRS